MTSFDASDILIPVTSAGVSQQKELKMATGLKEGYIPVTARIATFWAKYPDKGSIQTEVFLSDGTDDEGKFILINTVKATLSNDGNIIATGFDQGIAGDDKELAKTETAAIGRALANAGFPSIDPAIAAASEAEEEEESAPRASRLGRRSAAPAEPVSTIAAKVKTTKLTSAAPVKVAAEVSEESEVEDNQAEPNSAPAPVQAAPAKSSTSLQDMMAKYRNGKASAAPSALAGLKR